MKSQTPKMVFEASEVADFCATDVATIYTWVKKGEIPYLNRLLLEDAFPSEIAPHRFTPKTLLWINLAIFAIIGFLVYVPVMFSGVMSLDLTTKKAVGTAAGFVGFFGYVGGRMIQGKGLG